MLEIDLEVEVLLVVGRVAAAHIDEGLGGRRLEDLIKPLPSSSSCLYSAWHCAGSGCTLTPRP